MMHEYIPCENMLNSLDHLQNADLNRIMEKANEIMKERRKNPKKFKYHRRLEVCKLHVKCRLTSRDSKLRVRDPMEESPFYLLESDYKITEFMSDDNLGPFEKRALELMLPEHPESNYGGMEFSDWEPMGSEEDDEGFEGWYQTEGMAIYEYAFCPYHKNTKSGFGFDNSTERIVFFLPNPKNPDEVLFYLCRKDKQIFPIPSINEFTSIVGASSKKDLRVIKTPNGQEWELYSRELSEDISTAWIYPCEKLLKFMNRKRVNPHTTTTTCTSSSSSSSNSPSSVSTKKQQQNE